MLNLFTLLSSSRRRAFTAVEVMVSISLFAIGLTSVIGVQRLAIRTNYHARRLDVASNIGQMWMDRLRRDATLWTTPSASFPTSPSNRSVTNTPLIATISAAGEWQLPLGRVDETPPVSPGFDLVGEDMARVDLPNAMFCVNTRLTWLRTEELIRAEVRVFWPKNYELAPLANVCTANPPATLGEETDRYNFVYLVSSLQRNAGL